MPLNKSTTKVQTNKSPQKAGGLRSASKSFATAGRTNASTKVSTFKKPSNPANRVKSAPKPVPKVHRVSQITTGPIKASKLRFVSAVRPQSTQTGGTPSYNSMRTQKPPVCYYARQGGREYMEDTFQIMHFKIGNKEGTFYGVFDGHGGKDVSYELVESDNSRGLFPFLIENIQKTNGRSIPQVIKASFLEYDKRLFSKKFNAGSTAVVILNYDKKLYLINLGDSRGMVFSKNRLIAVSSDHKPQKPQERSRIYRAGHFVTPFNVMFTKAGKTRFNVGDIFSNKGKNYIYLNGKWEPITSGQYSQIRSINQEMDTNRVSNSLALSRAFGDFYLKTDQNGKYMGGSAAISPIPDIQIMDLNKLRNQAIYIFLASDGYWDVNRNTAALRRSLVTHPTPQVLIQNLVDNSIKKGSEDNITVVFDKILT